jgi:hypothetical protein
MSAATYMQQYLELAVVLGDSEVQTASIDKYLNLAVKPRGDQAWTARDLVLNEMIAETKSNWKATQFYIDGFVISQKAISKAFTGKGSPSEVKTALRMAHRYGFITNSAKPRRGSKSLDDYTDAYSGLDCNGFVGNYLGIDPTTPVSEFAVPKLRLSKVDDIDADTTLVWYQSSNSAPYRHLAIIESVIQRAEPLTFQIVHSNGPDAAHGVHDEVYTKRAAEIRKDSKGHLYFSDWGGAAQVYFCAPPPHPCDSNE